MGALTTLTGVFLVAVHALVGGLFRLFKIHGLILTPFKMLGSVAMGALGLMSSAVATALGGIGTILASAFAGMTSIAVAGWAAQIAVWRGALAFKIGMFTAFVAKFRMAMVLAMMTGSGYWAAFWAAMKLLTVTGMATQFAWFRKMMGLVAIVSTLGTAIAVAWTRTWALVGAINAAGWALVRTQWIVASVMGLGLWSKFRAAFVVIHATTAAAAAAIWRGFALVMLSTSKAVVAFFIGGFLKIIPFLLKFGKFLVNPWALAALAIMGVIYAFRDQIVQVWNNIVQYLSDETNGISRGFASVGDAIMSVFNKLPAGVQNAMVAVVTVVRDAALAVYEWFSYINPFARHSPSLVENVDNGMDRILAKFSNLSQIKKYTTAAYAEIKRFGELTAKVGLNAAAAEQQENRKSLKKAGAGAALASYDRLMKLMNKLQPILTQLEGKIAAQEKVVERWQKKLDKANHRLDDQQDKLGRLQDKLQKYQDLLSSAEADLDRYASAPLVGMREMENQIFANQMAQTRLRLAMMDMEDVVGTYDDLKEKMEAINGLQEILRGTQTDLRNAGAGSEILSQYDAELKKLEDQKQTYTEAAEKINSMQVELQRLQREAERLDLVKAMKFDELQYRIAQAADSTREMSFDEIMSGIAGANAEIAKYGPLVAEATRKVEEQQAAVDRATKTRDAIQAQLDAEQATLDKIKQKYDEVNDSIRAIEQSINDVLTAADKLESIGSKKKGAKGGAGGSDYISPGLQNFLDAGKADFPDPGGKGIPPRSDWSNQADQIDKFTEQLGADTADMFAQLNPFKPIKEKALLAWEWIKDKARNAAGKVGEFFSAAFNGVTGGGDVLQNIKDKVMPVLEFITEVARDIGSFFGAAWKLLWPQLKKIGRGVWDGLKTLWEKVGPKLEEFKELWGPMGEAIKNMWKVAKPILAILAGGLLLGLTTLLSMIGEAIGPAIEAIGTILGGFVDLVKGIVKVIVGIFTLDLGMILGGVANIFQGLWGIIWGIFGGGVRVVWNLIQGFVFGIRDFFVWLWDVLVGHSIVPDIVDGIIAVFERLASLAQWVWDNVLKPIWNFFSMLWTDYLKPFLSGLWDKVKAAWALLKGAGRWIWDNVLKPVKDFFVALWTDHVRPKLSEWWGNIKVAWAALAALGRWVWDNVLKPVKDFFVGLWTDHVKPKLGEWWENIKTVWDKLTGLGDWVTKNVMDPVKSAFVSGWQAIKTWFIENADILTNPVETVVNTVLNAVNAMIRGLNKVSDVLPGIDWHIDEITTLAKGGQIPGRKAGRGFMTTGARAIVGEGKPNHPEFVIPTDPTHRRRAVSLLTMAASKIGMGPGIRSNVAGDTAKDMAAVMRKNGTVSAQGVPQFGIGGWLSDKWGDLKGIAKEVAALPKAAVGEVMDPVLSKARDKVNSLTWDPPKAPPLYGIGKLEKWVNGADSVVNSSRDKADEMVTGGPRVKKALAWAKTQAGKPYVWGGVGPDGYDCSGFMSAITNHLMGRSLHSRVGATASFPWGGFTFGIKPNGFSIGSAKNYGGTGIGHMAGTLGGVNVESAGGVGVRIGSSARGANDLGFETRAHLAMKQGGIALARRGSPTDVTIGDGRYDEAVVPLPHGWQNLREPAGGGNKTYNFYGDMEFPNVTNGDDVDDFITNLENLAEG